MQSKTPNALPDTNLPLDQTHVSLYKDEDMRKYMYKRVCVCVLRNYLYKLVNKKNNHRIKIFLMTKGEVIYHLYNYLAKTNITTI